MGTLYSEILMDNTGVSLWTSTAIFAVALAVAFIGWYRSEHTLSIHAIVTRRREAWYWFAIVCTFSRLSHRVPQAPAHAPARRAPQQLRPVPTPGPGGALSWSGRSQVKRPTVSP